MEEVPCMDGIRHRYYLFCILSHINKYWLSKVLSLNYFYTFVLIFGIASFSRWLLLGVLNIQQNLDKESDNLDKV